MRFTTVKNDSDDAAAHHLAVLLAASVGSSTTASGSECLRGWRMANKWSGTMFKMVDDDKSCLVRVRNRVDNSETCFRVV